MDYKEIFSKTYKGRKVFVTGHTGFKGSWLLMWLHDAGAHVKGYSLAPESEADLYVQIDGDKLCQSVIADILDLDRLSREINDFQPDFIFHLAAQPLVRRSYAEPVYTFQVNFNGTMHVLETLRSFKKKCVTIIVTTDKVYENLETGHAYIESDKLGGKDPYSASKAAAELVTASYRHSFFANENYETHRQSVATARAGNVIGGGDWSADRIIPDIVRALDSGRPVEIRNPDSVRPWQHVLEPVAGYLLLASIMDEKPQDYNTAWNFGPETTDTKTVLELVKEAIRCWEHGEYVVKPSPASLHEAGLLNLGIGNTTEKLGWRPRWDSDVAIRRTLQWYKNLHPGHARELSLRQLHDYIELT